MDKTIDENIIIIKEVAHLFNKAKRKNRIMALNIDITKAFDSLKIAQIKSFKMGCGILIKLFL